MTDLSVADLVEIGILHQDQANMLLDWELGFSWQMPALSVSTISVHDAMQIARRKYTLSVMQAQPDADALRVLLTLVQGLELAAMWSLSNGEGFVEKLLTYGERGHHHCWVVVPATVTIEELRAANYTEDLFIKDGEVNYHGMRD